MWSHGKTLHFFRLWLRWSTTTFPFISSNLKQRKPQSVSSNRKPKLCLHPPEDIFKLSKVPKKKSPVSTAAINRCLKALPPQCHSRTPPRGQAGRCRNEGPRRSSRLSSRVWRGSWAERAPWIQRAAARCSRWKTLGTIDFLSWRRAKRYQIWKTSKVHLFFFIWSKQYVYGQKYVDTLQSFYFYPFHLTDHLTRQLDLHARVRHDHQLLWELENIFHWKKSKDRHFSLRKRCFFALLSTGFSRSVIFANSFRSHLSTLPHTWEHCTGVVRKPHYSHKVGSILWISFSFKWRGLTQTK